MAESSRGGRGRRWVGWLLVAGVAGLAAGAWVVGSRIRSADQAAAEAAPPARSVVTVPVEERVLSSTVITRGDVVPAVSTVVSGPSPAGGAVGTVTGVFVGVGDSVPEGARVVEVAGRPVFVLVGAVPAYRSLRPGMVGADVRQLQEALARTGCAVGVSGVFDEATKRCVGQLYESQGYQVIRSSESEEAALANAKAAVADSQDSLANAQAALEKKAAGPSAGELLAARQELDAATRDRDAKRDAAAVVAAAQPGKVDTAIASLNGVLASSSSGVAERQVAVAGLRSALAGVGPEAESAALALEAAEAAVVKAQAGFDVLSGAPEVSAERRAVEQAQQRVQRDLDALDAVQTSSGPTVPFGEVVFVPKAPARVDSVTAKVGAVVGAGGGSPGGEGQQSGAGSGGLMVLASAGLEVRVSLQQADVGLLRAGMAVELLDEATGVRLPATLTSVSAAPVADANGGSSFPAVAVGDAAIPAEWSGRNVRVTITAASTSGKVLVVPLAAVSSAADGSTRVQVKLADGGLRVTQVDVGVSADGFVEVRPTGDAELRPGDAVVVSS